MKPRTGILIASTLAAVVALPILALIALGTYGSASGGAGDIEQSTSAQLSIDPSQGLPGSAATVKGNDWPARAEVSIMLARQRREGEPMKTRLASGVASRSGSFAIDVVIPPSLIGQDTKLVFIEARTAEIDGTPVNPAPLEFKLIPYPNEVSVRVLDRVSGDPLSQAFVELRDPFGNAIHRASTGAGGLAGISDVRPGRLTVHARMRDYLSGSAAMDMPDSGRVEISIHIEPSPEKRLYFSYMAPAGLGTVKVAGVDRSSGLRSDLTLRLPPNQLGQRADGDQPMRLMTNFQFLVAAGSSASAGGRSGGTSDQLDAAFKYFRAAGIPIVSTGESLGPYIFYVGQTSAGEVALLIETDIKSTFSNVLAVDPDSGRTRTIARGFSVFDTAPVLSIDGSRLFVLRRAGSRLDILDTESGAVVGRLDNVPQLVSRIVDSPAGNDLYLLTGLGDIYRTNTVSKRLEGPLTQIPGATSMAISGDGRKLYVVGAGLESIVLVDLADDYSQSIAPLEGSAYWIWADPDGPFIFAGDIRRTEVTVIHGESLHVTDRLEFNTDAD